MSCPTKAKEHCELKKKQNKVNKVAKYQTTTMMMKCFCGMVDRQKTFRPISSGTIARDSYHRESPIRRKQDLNERRT